MDAHLSSITTNRPIGFTGWSARFLKKRDEYIASIDEARSKQAKPLRVGGQISQLCKMLIKKVCDKKMYT